MGFNHVAIEVGDIDEALAFYGRLFEFKLHSRSKDMAFIDLGDQFLALQTGRRQPTDDGRHLGLVVDDKEAVRRALAEAGVNALPGPFLDFLDPWGNRIEIVGYDNIQFSKSPNVLRGMGLAHLYQERQSDQGTCRKGHGAGLVIPAPTRTPNFSSDHTPRPLVAQPVDPPHTLTPLSNTSAATNRGSIRDAALLAEIERQPGDSIMSP